MVRLIQLGELPDSRDVSIVLLSGKHKKTRLTLKPTGFSFDLRNRRAPIEPAFFVRGFEGR